MKISVLMPAYNESETIQRVVHRVMELPIQEMGLSDIELVIVNDGSTDDTANIIQRLAAEESRIRIFDQPRNMGKTAAIARALSESSGDVIIVQDADTEYDPREIPDVIRPIVEDVADVVYGSRFLVKRAARVLYYYHYLANKFLTLLSNLCTNRNMSDIETCYKAFRREVIAPMELTSSGFGMEVEITAMICKTRARTYEVPISYYGRTYEEGKKISTVDGIAALWYIAYYNLIYAWTGKARAYVSQVNQSLADRHQS